MIVPRLSKGGWRAVLAFLLGDGGLICRPHEGLDGASAHAAFDLFLAGHWGRDRDNLSGKLTYPGKSPLPASRKRVGQRIP